MEFLLWLASIIGTIVAWEVFGMGLDWWGRAQDWLTWGRQDPKSEFYLWSYRLGPLQIFRMK